MNYTGWYNDVSVKDTSTLPNTPIPGKFYKVLVARTDRDGNDIAGVRHPELQGPARHSYRMGSAPRSLSPKMKTAL